MNQKTAGKKILFCAILILVSGCMSSNAWAQQPLAKSLEKLRALRKVDVTIVETELSGKGFTEEANADIPGLTDLRLGGIKPDVNFNAGSESGGGEDRYSSDKDISEMQLETKQIIDTNRTLRKMIEENQNLSEKNRQLDLQLRNVRGQMAIENTRIKNVSKERDSLKARMGDMIEVRDQVQSQLADVQKRVEAREFILQKRIEDMEAELARQEESIGTVPGVPVMEEKQKFRVALSDTTPQEPIAPKLSVQKKILEDQTKSLDVIDMIDDLTQESAQLKNDEAKIHYNMGNIFFNQGDYHKAAKEYALAVELMPADANAHFNLAFVSSEYMEDLRTAIDHYQQYLILNPEAEDAALVKEKILEAELFLKSEISSSLENDVRENRKAFFIQ